MQDRRRAGRVVPRVDSLDDRCLLSGYTPNQIVGSYGLNAITFTSATGSTIVGNGSGQTIALIEEYHDPNIQADLKTFDSEYNLPDPSLTVVNLAGDQTDDNWTIEESMDVEYAHAIAPGAGIVVVEAAPSSSPTQAFLNLLNAENAARNMPRVSAISMSWGFPEMANEASYDQFFTTPSGHTGITFIAASGDNGFETYPAVSPDVLSVGGTTLSLTSSGSYASETAWFDSGGGYSLYEAEPGYQRSVQTTGQRATPDVSFDGDPNTGVEVYATSPSTGEGSWQTCGGTSLGAPCWAGLTAIVDQGRELAGKGSLDGPTQTLPALYAIPSSDFHSVSPASALGGLSSGLSFLFGTDSSGATANIATGLGSPDGRSLVNGLVTSTLTTPLTTSSTGTGSAATTLIPRTKSIVRGPKHHHKARHHTKIVRIKFHAPQRVVNQGSRSEKPGSRHPYLF